MVAIPFIVIPGAIDALSSWIGIYYPPATVFLLAIFVLFLISIHFSRQLTRLEERTRILAEELALLGVERSARAPAEAPAASAGEADSRPNVRPGEGMVQPGSVSGP